MELYYQTSDSITLTIYVNGTLQDADSTPTVTITRLDNDTQIATAQPASAISTGKYKFILTTAMNQTLGKYRAVWSYIINGIPNTKTDYYDVVVGYANAQQVKDFYPSLATKTNEEIYNKEKLARKIIDVYANQSFGFEEDVTKIFRGEDENKLFLNRRIYNIEQVLIEGTDDVTSELEILDDYWICPVWDSRPGYYVDTKKGFDEPGRYFRRPIKYHVKGDWGWESVPDDINLAAIMLINDYFCDDSLLRQHGVLSVQFGDRDMTFRRDLWGTTGNYDVDMLLSNYTYVDLRLI